MGARRRWDSPELGSSDLKRETKVFGVRDARENALDAREAREFGSQARGAKEQRGACFIGYWNRCRPLAWI